jgi:hypothetical protein
MDAGRLRTEVSGWRAAALVAAVALGAAAAAVLAGPGAPLAEPAPAPVAVEAVPPTPAPTALPPAAGEPMVVPVAAAEPTAVAAETPARVVVTRVVDGLMLTLSAGPAWQVTPVALLPPLEEEIVAAYLHYWDVRMRAYHDLDTSELGTVMAGDELAREEDGIREMRSQGHAGLLDIDHNFRLLHLDPVTKRGIPTNEPPATVKISFQMKRIGGVWKVVDGARHE